MLHHESSSYQKKTTNRDEHNDKGTKAQTSQAGSQQTEASEVPRSLSSLHHEEPLQPALHYRARPYHL